MRLTKLLMLVGIMVFCAGVYSAEGLGAVKKVPPKKAAQEVKTKEGQGPTQVGQGPTIEKEKAAVPLPLNAEDRRIITILKEELSRYFAEFKKNLADKAPYYIEAQIIDSADRAINGSYGTLYSNASRRTVRLVIDCRIGDYADDNTGFEKKTPFLAEGLVSLDAEPLSLRRDIWQLMDQAYKHNLELYFYKQKDEVKSAKSDSKSASFSKETPVVYFEPPRAIVFSPEPWVGLLKELSFVFRKYAEIYDDKFFFNYGFTKRYFVNTEGFEIITRDETAYLILSAQVQAFDGTLLDNYATLYSNRSDRLPSKPEIEKERDRMIKEVLAVKNAPIEEPRTAPAIFSPEASATLFHEAIGHRLEGERQEAESSGQTFKEQLNNKIIPDMFTIVDDPTMGEFNGIPLIGSYTHDSEGIVAQKVMLVENGILRNFLLSRKPVLQFTKSNGHGRAQAGFRPIARMGVLRVIAKDGVVPEELRRLLIGEAKKQKKPYAYYVDRLEGGETNTARVGFQALLSKPKIVYRFDVATGAREVIRGVEIVGTPLTLVSKIIKAGTDYGVFNGFCGAESGTIPVSHISPSVLISEVELQRQQAQKTKHPLIERPKEP